MSPRSQCVIVGLGIVAAAILYWFHRDGGKDILIFLGGSPVAGAAVSAVNAITASKKPANPDASAKATPDAADPPPPGQ